MDRTIELEEMIKQLLAIIDSGETKGAFMNAWVHGYRVDPAVSEQNGKTIDAAYALIELKRPEP
jgi:hypothetical protein